jgi:hypothetical protein
VSIGLINKAPALSTLNSTTDVNPSGQWIGRSPFPDAFAVGTVKYKPRRELCNAESCAGPRVHRGPKQFR